MRLAQINAGTLEQLVVRLQAMVARINTVWGKEHHADGRHILPQWHEVPYNVANFTADSAPAVTWTVDATSTYDYWKHGDCLSLSFVLNGILSAAASHVIVRLPEQMVSRDYAVNVVDLATESAGAITGIVYAQPGNAHLWVLKTDRGALTAGDLNVNGQLQLRTTV